MNIYEKINTIKENILKSNLKKTGKNNYAGFDYYELSDFLPTIINYCKEQKITTAITFNNEVATLIIINSELPEERIEYTSPMRKLDLKGCNEIQGLGGIETYQRRYLYMNAFDIVENDMFDNNDNLKQKVLNTFKNSEIIPTEEDIKKYILEKQHMNINSLSIFNYCQSKNWKDKNGNMINYKTICDYFEKNNNSNNNKK